MSVIDILEGGESDEQLLHRYMSLVKQRPEGPERGECFISSRIRERVDDILMGRGWRRFGNHLTNGKIWARDQRVNRPSYRTDEAVEIELGNLIVIDSMAT